MSDAPLKVSVEREGRLLSLQLARPKANIVDAEMIAALESALADAAGNPAYKAVLIGAEGPHFSFGASVEEHLPANCAAMLTSLHALVRQIFEFPVPVLVAVRGQCLGGGLELALAGHRMFAAPDAHLGQPEIKLGVFAPAASVLLPVRVGQAGAEDLLLSGRSIDAGEALRLCLVNAIEDDPEAAALAYFDEHLAPLSASSLRYAVGATRGALHASVRERLDAVEALYLDELMQSRDAVEGLTAFMERRPAEWENG